jgi:hypothetical protein
MKNVASIVTIAWLTGCNLSSVKETTIYENQPCPGEYLQLPVRGKPVGFCCDSFEIFKSLSESNQEERRRNLEAGAVTEFISEWKIKYFRGTGMHLTNEKLSVGSGKIGIPKGYNINGIETVYKMCGIAAPSPDLIPTIFSK